MPAYEAALQKSLPADVRTLVERQYEGVKANHDRSAICATPQPDPAKITMSETPMNVTAKAFIAGSMTLFLAACGAATELPFDFERT
jgi:hypothetical protein